MDQIKIIIFKENKMRKALSLMVVLVSIGILLSACSAAQTPAPTKSTVDIPNVQTGSATATVSTIGYPAPTSPSAQSAYPAGTGPSLNVTKPDGTSVKMDQAALSNIPTSVVNAGTASYTGIALPDLLAAAGIKDYKQITLTGSGGSQVLTKDKVTNKMILVTNPDGLQLVSPDLPDASWLKAVSALKVE